MRTQISEVWEASEASQGSALPRLQPESRLPEGEETTLEFTPEKPGEYGFQGQRGTLHGKLIVESLAGRRTRGDYLKPGGA